MPVSSATTGSAPTSGTCSDTSRASTRRPSTSCCAVRHGLPARRRSRSEFSGGAGGLARLLDPRADHRPARSPSRARRSVPRPALRPAAADAVQIGRDHPRLHPPAVSAVPAQQARLRLRARFNLGGGAPVEPHPDGVGGVQARHPRLLQRAAGKNPRHLQRHRRDASASRRQRTMWRGCASATSWTTRSSCTRATSSRTRTSNVRSRPSTSSGGAVSSTRSSSSSSATRSPSTRRCGTPSIGTSCTNTCGSSASSPIARSRSCIDSPACSCFRRSTKASGCRRSRPWPAARPSSPRMCPLFPRWSAMRHCSSIRFNPRRLPTRYGGS